MKRVMLQWGMQHKASDLLLKPGSRPWMYLNGDHKKIPHGRTAVLEALLATAAIRNLIREDKVVQMVVVMQTGEAQGMCTLEQSLQDLIADQVIPVQAASELANQREIVRV